MALSQGGGEEEGSQECNLWEEKLQQSDVLSSIKYSCHLSACLLNGTFGWCHLLASWAASSKSLFGGKTYFKKCMAQGPGNSPPLLLVTWSSSTLSPPKTLHSQQEIRATGKIKADTTAGTNKLCFERLLSSLHTGEVNSALRCPPHPKSGSQGGALGRCLFSRKVWRATPTYASGDGWLHQVSKVNSGFNPLSNSSNQ